MCSIKSKNHIFLSQIPGRTNCLLNNCWRKTVKCCLLAAIAAPVSERVVRSSRGWWLKSHAQQPPELRVCQLTNSWAPEPIAQQSHALCVSLSAVAISSKGALSLPLATAAVFMWPSASTAPPASLSSQPPAEPPAEPPATTTGAWTPRGGFTSCSPLGVNTSQISSLSSSAR